MTMGSAAFFVEPHGAQGLIYAFASLSGRCAKIVILDYMMASRLRTDGGSEAGHSSDLYLRLF